MNGSSFKDPEIAGSLSSGNWRSRKKGDKTDLNTAVPEVDSRRNYFRRKSQYEKQSYGTSQHGDYQSRGRSANRRPSSQGRYNKQRTETYNQPRYRHRE